MDFRICFVGGSFVNGTGDPEYLGWTGQVCAAALKQGIRVTYYNLGVRRETSADIRARWRKEVTLRLPEEHPTGMVFSFGVNDTTPVKEGGRIAYGDSIANTRSILREASEVYRIFMVGPVLIAHEHQNSSIAKLSQGAEEVCTTLGVPYLEVFSSLHESAIWMDEGRVRDGSRPSPMGYAEFAGLVISSPTWWDWLRKGSEHG